MAVTTEQLVLYLLTDGALVRCRATGRLTAMEVTGTDLDGETLREVCQDPFEPRRLWAASTTDVYVSEDGGVTWSQLPSGGIAFREIWAMAVHPTRPHEVYVGTMPAAVYVSENGGRSFRELASFRQLPDYGRWTFPPAPHTAHIRCIALDARAPDEIVVGIEEGGVARSRDRGETWEDASGPPSETAFPRHNDPAGLLPYEPGDVEPGRVYRDVHWVMRHATRPETFYAATGKGTYRTDDGGRTWERLVEGLPVVYALLLAGHPVRPERLFLGAAGNNPPGWKGPRPARGGPYVSSRYARDLSEKLGGAKAVVFRSDDAGRSWRPLAGGLPVEHPYVVTGVQVHPRDPDTVVVSYADGSIYGTTDAGEHWERVTVSYPKLYGVRLFVQP